MGEQVRDDIVIGAHPDTVWSVITDVARYPEWAEGVRATEVLAITDDDAPARARFTVDAKVAELTYVLAYRYEGYDVIWELAEGETISQLDGAYRLTETADGGTRVVYELTVDVDLPVPTFMKKRAARTILQQGLEGLRERAEALEG